MTWQRRFGGVLRDMWREYVQDRLSGLAAEVAFWTLLSIPFAALAVVAMLGWLPTGENGTSLQVEVREQVDTWLGAVFGASSQETIGPVVDELFQEPQGGLFTVAVIAAIYSASRGFAAVIRALDVAYDIEEVRPWLGVRILAVGMSVGTLAVTALTLAVVVVGPLLGFGTGAVMDDPVGGTLWRVLSYPLMFAVLVVWAATIFHLAPNHRTPWRWDLPGAAFTGIFWILASVAFRVYTAFSSNSNAITSSIAILIAAMLWIYFLSFGLLLGGELNAVLWRRAHPGEAQPTGKTWTQVARERLRARWRAYRGTGAPAEKESRSA